MGEIWAAAIGAAAAVGGVIASKDSSRKAINAQKDAGKASQIDINALDDQTRRIALQNAQDSANLEQLMTPEVPQLRRDANNALLAGLANNASSDKYRAMLEAQLGRPLNTPLLNEAIAKARSDLGLGGTLSQDVQNATLRKGLATAGSVGTGLGLGRDLVARDLGLTSQGLEQQRLMNAFQGGSLEHNLATDNSSQLLNQVNLLQSINGQRNNFALGAAQYGQSIQQPIVGLDPASVANLATGNASNSAAYLANRANIYGAQGQGYAQAAGQLGGAAASIYAGYKGSTPTVNNALYGTSGTGYHG